ncbi:MAG: hypothetical protein FWD25_06300 [Clostridia bacterium]|nr:hypothetical protein [Clostridia bacterium]
MVRIDSHFGDALISGEKCSERELKEKVKKALKVSETGNFVALFCRMFMFEEHFLQKDVHADFIIDLDTHSVYTPRYTSPCGF